MILFGFATTEGKVSFPCLPAFPRPCYRAGGAWSGLWLYWMSKETLRVLVIPGQLLFHLLWVSFSFPLEVTAQWQRALHFWLLQLST